MPRSLAKLLFDVLDRSQAVRDATAGRTLDDYRRDRVLRSAVERELEVLGEAVRQAIRLDPTLEASIPDAKQVVAFRNWLAHAYADIDEEIVWAIVQHDVPKLERDVRALYERLS